MEVSCRIACRRRDSLLRVLFTCAYIVLRLASAEAQVLVRDIRAGTQGCDPFSPVVVNGTLFLQANDGIRGGELWKSDGTTAGTVLVRDIHAAGASNPLNLTSVNGTLFFTANDGIHGTELWRSDGTTAGTVLVKDIWPGVSGSGPFFLTDVNGTLFFQAHDGVTGVELWKSDGTAAGTVLVKDVQVGVNGSGPSQLTHVNGTLFFTASDLSGGTGTELWKSNGTTAGTVIVKDILPGGASSSPVNLTRAGSTLFFRANDGTTGGELWKSDGSTAGTVRVRDIFSGGSSSNPAELTDVNGTLFFSATDGTAGIELWKSNGTTAGTVLVKDISPGGSGSSPAEFTEMNGMLFFRATDGVTGSELWTSDGTAAGTALVKDIRPGSSGSSASDLTACGGTLFFRAIDGTFGIEPWVSNGTPAGTVLAADLLPGSGSGMAFEPRFTPLSPRVFFFADDGAMGRELWSSMCSPCSSVAYRDADNDGYGDASVSLQSCLAPSGYVSNAQDCDDTRSSVHPGAVESCNGTDDDCSGQADDRLGTDRHGWWPAENTPQDGTGRHHGLLGGGAGFAEGRFGQAFALDGIDDFVVIPDSPDLRFASEFTLKAWIKPSDVDGYRAILSKWGLDGSGNFAYKIYTAPNGALRFDVSADGLTYDDGVLISPPAVIGLGAWSHVVATFDAGEQKLYVNGGLVGSRVSSIASVNAGLDPLFIGADIATPHYFLGLIDEAQVFDRALIAAEVQALYNENLAGWWPAENIPDDGAGRHHGTLRNGAGFAAGQVGQAFSLDGIDDYVANLGTASTFSFIQNTGVFTIEGWIRLDDPDAPRVQTIAANIFNIEDRGFFFGALNNNGQQGLGLTLSRGGPFPTGLIIDSRSPDGLITAGWHHVAATGNGTSVTFYVDGVAYAGSGTMGALSSGHGPRAVNIGYDDAATYFAGRIDEFSIHDRTLNSHEIRAIHGAGSGGRCALVSVNDRSRSVPALQFDPARPNPTSRGVEIEFRLPWAARVGTRIMDVTGREVASLLRDAELPAGAHRLRWDCRGTSGRRVAPGVFFVQVSTGSSTAVQRIVVVE